MTTAQSSEPFATIVIAVFNEAAVLDKVCLELTAKLADCPPHEVIFVDDGSTDDSAGLLRRWCARHPHWRLLQHDRRGGKSAAMRTGIRHANAAWIALMDADGQNDPDDVLALLRAGAGRDALVAGCRQRRRDTVRKRLGSRFANALRRAVLNDECPDTGCGLKAFRRDDFLELPSFEGQHRFLPALFLAYGHQVICHPVSDRPRAGGVSKYTNWGRAVVGVFDLLGVVWLRRRTRRPAAREITP